jgi:hypothetical protein
MKNIKRVLNVSLIAFSAFDGTLQNFFWNIAGGDLVITLIWIAGEIL